MKKSKIKVAILLPLFSLFLLFPYWQTVKSAINIPPPNTDSVNTPKNVTVSKSDPVDVDTNNDGLADVRLEYMGTDTVTGMPKIKTTDLTPRFVGGQPYKDSPFIAEYIALMYKYAVTLVTILTTIMIIVAGVQWTVSAGNAEKIGRAKQMIGRSLTGLFIALGSYALLYTINPNLVNFTSLQILTIEEGLFDIQEDLSMPDGDVAPLPSMSSLQNIPNVNFEKGVNPQALSDTVTDFKKAIEFYANNYGGKNVTITSALRTPAAQYELLTSNCGCVPIENLPAEMEKNNTKIVEKGQWAPYCKALQNCSVGYKSLSFENGSFKAPLISHLGGNAIDISAQPSGATQPCGAIADVDVHLSGEVVNVEGRRGPDYCVPKEQQKLIRAMLINNFCVLLGEGNLREPWHFEHIGYGKRVSANCSADLGGKYLSKLYYTLNPVTP